MAAVAAHPCGVDFDAASTVTQPAAVILDTMLERIEVIAPFLRNVERIETLERDVLADGRLRIVRRWQASADAVPRAARPFITTAMLAWIDTAVWTPADGRADWTHATCASAVAQLYSCTGTSRIEPDAGDPSHRTRIRVSGCLQVHADVLPGIPAFLGRRLAPQIEAFIVAMITPNLTGLAEGLQRYFDAGRG